MKKEDRPWGLIKEGDIVKDFPDSFFEDSLFEVNGLTGNAYCPILDVYFLGKSKETNKYRMNLDARFVILKSAKKRPFRNMPNKALYKLIAKGNLEAKRELKIRINNKR